MTTDAELFRICPVCGSRRPVSEPSCLANAGGGICGWDLQQEDIVDPGEPQQETPSTRDTPPTVTLSELRCSRGHLCSPGDLMCPICNEDLSLPPDTVNAGDAENNDLVPMDQASKIGGWKIVSRLKAAGETKQRFIVENEATHRRAVLTLYSRGASPNGAVYDVLRKISKEHVPELLETGTWNGQAFEVAEEICEGTFAELNLDCTNLETVRSFVFEVGKALAVFAEKGLRHRDIRPETILVRSRDPLDIVITGFGSARLSDLDFEIESPLETGRYMAPEAVMGGVSAASDWWGLGAILLDKVTRGECFASANDQLYMIHVVANGVSIPSGIDARLELLLRGLLERDRMQRWQWREVKAWLDGVEISAPAAAATMNSQPSGPGITLGGRTYRSVNEFALTAAKVAHWDEAVGLLAHGTLAAWAQDLNLDQKTVAALRQLTAKVEIADDFRLSLALHLLFPVMPLIYRETIITPAWLSFHPEEGYALISGPIPELLRQYGGESQHWLHRFAQRCSVSKHRADSCGIELDESTFRVCLLASSRSRLETLWEERRPNFPDANSSGVAAILDRRSYSDEDLILLISATLGQFRSSDEVIETTMQKARESGIVCPETETVRSLIQQRRLSLYDELEKRLEGFSKSGVDIIDKWVDEFRIRRRMDIEELLLVLSVPRDAWKQPPHQQYVSQLMGFFEKKMSGSILRGPLVRMTIGKTTPRIDLTELAAEESKADDILNLILHRGDRQHAISQEVFDEEQSPERRLRRLDANTASYKRDTGINGAYMGFPFLLIGVQVPGRKPRILPVLLWPIKLNCSIGGRGRISLGFDKEREEVRLNPALEALIGIDAAVQWRKAASDLLSKADVTVGNVMDGFCHLAAANQRSLRRIPERNSYIASRADELTCSAVLFHVAFAGQSVVEDLRQLSARPIAGSALERMLRLPPGEVPADTEDGVTAPLEFLLAESDPSQDLAIQKSNGSTGLVIQGPPGTGKSQTIVNLIADAIGKQKSVLVVCQKLPALEVVKKRLESHKLQDRFCMVTDIHSDRWSIISAIREQREKITAIREHRESLFQADDDNLRRRAHDRQRLTSRIASLEAELDAANQAFRIIDPLSGKTYREIIDELLTIESQIGSAGWDLRGLREMFAHMTAADVLRTEDECSALAATWLQSDFEHNPLRSLNEISSIAGALGELRTEFHAMYALESHRDEIVAETPSAIRIDDAVAIDQWLRLHKDWLFSLTNQQFSLLSDWKKLFINNLNGPRLIECLSHLIEISEENVTSVPEMMSLRSLLATVPERAITELSQECSASADLWLKVQFEDSPLHAFSEFVADSSTLNHVQTLLTAFRDADLARVQAFQKASSIRDVAQHEPIQAWLEKFGEVFRSIDASTCQRVTTWLPLFEAPAGRRKRGEALLERLKAFQAHLSLLEIDSHSESFGELINGIPQGELPTWLKTGARAFCARPGLFSSLNPFRMSARRRIRKFLASAGVAGDPSSVVEFAKCLVLEQQLISIRREWKNGEMLGISGMSVSPSVSAHALEHQIAGAAAQLQKVADIAEAFQARPIPLKISEEKLGDPASYQTYVRYLEVAAQRSLTRTHCLTILRELREYMNGQWAGQAEKSIGEGASASEDVPELLDSLPRLNDFQLFRARLKSMNQIAGEVFAGLSHHRSYFLSLPQSELRTHVAWSIRQNAYLGTAQRIIQAEKVLNRVSVGSLPDWIACKNALNPVKRFADAFVSCPAPQICWEAADRTADSLQKILEMLQQSAKRGHARIASRKAIEDFTRWMEPNWVAACLANVSEDMSNKPALSRIDSAMPTLHAFLVFRNRWRQLSENNRVVFRQLAKTRDLFLKLGESDLSETMRKVIGRAALLAWKNRIEMEIPRLATEQTEFRTNVAKLRESIESLRALNAEFLSANIKISNLAARSEWESITRKQGPRALSFRDFYQRGLQLGLHSLRPVWLMIPGIASQILPLDAGMFDLVIFDEASQMPVEQALPSLYRARVAVVSGDEKQMPPSAFFASQLESDENEADEAEQPDEDASDQERENYEQAWNRREIKDCPDLLHLAEAVLPRSMLQIHYRSRFRELIAFSNSAFYRNELSVHVVHPDKRVIEERPIEYIPVNGTYGDQTNVAEAKKVVQYLERLWKSSSNPRPSVGIVTFNRKQADVIEELLEERAEKNDFFREVYSAERQRIDNDGDMSIFVKNVENVQGDERDVMIFSTTFGRNEQGTFRRNFGVLGQKGGERRLNVAVTRARLKVAIITSMPIAEISDMLEQKRKPVSPRDFLQGYLEYARLLSNGHLNEARQLVIRMNSGDNLTMQHQERPFSGLAQSVATFVNSIGYEPLRPDADPVLGVDLAIVDPETGLFGVGIECDVPNHPLLSRASARDIWRQSMIARIYKTVIRISPAEWYNNSETDRKRLATAIRNVIGAAK